MALGHARLLLLLSLLSLSLSPLVFAQYPVLCAPTGSETKPNCVIYTCKLANPFTTPLNNPVLFPNFAFAPVRQRGDITILGTVISTYLPRFGSTKQFTFCQNASIPVGPLPTFTLFANQTSVATFVYNGSNVADLLFNCNNPKYCQNGQDVTAHYDCIIINVSTLLKYSNIVLSSPDGTFKPVFVSGVNPDGTISNTLGTKCTYTFSFDQVVSGPTGGGSLAVTLGLASATALPK